MRRPLQTEWPAHNSSNAPRLVKVGKKKQKESRSLPPWRARDDTGGVGQHITTFSAPRLPGRVSVSCFGIEDFEVAVRGGLQELLIRSEEEHSLFYVQGAKSLSQIAEARWTTSAPFNTN